MKKINVHNVTESLSGKEMKAVTGGGEDGSKWCCPIKGNGECVFDQKCATDANCEELYGSNYACTGGGL